MAATFNSKSPNKYFTPHIGSLNSYLNEISKHEILPEKEIRRLLKLAKTGDKNAIDKIVKSQSRFVFSIAKRYSSGEYELLLDLINEGNIGVIQSIDKFKTSFDNKFITFSKDWVKKNIFEYLTYTNDAIRRPNKIKSTKIKKVSNKFLLENGRLPMASEIMDILEDEGTPVNNEHDVFITNMSSMSDSIDFDGSSDMESESEYNNLDRMCSLNEYEQEAEDSYYKTIIDSSIGILTPKEQTVVKLLYGIDQFKTYEISEVAETIGLTGEAVRQINIRALNKMKEDIIIKSSRI